MRKGNIAVLIKSARVVLNDTLMLNLEHVSCFSRQLSLVIKKPRILLKMTTKIALRSRINSNTLGSGLGLFYPCLSRMACLSSLKIMEITNDISRIRSDTSAVIEVPLHFSEVLTSKFSQ